MRPTRTHVRLALAAGAGAAIALSGGCYKKVVSAKGIGSSELNPEIKKPTTTITEDFGAAIMGDRKKRD